MYLLLMTYKDRDGGTCTRWDRGDLAGLKQLLRLQREEAARSGGSIQAIIFKVEVVEEC